MDEKRQRAIIKRCRKLNDFQQPYDPYSCPCDKLGYCYLDYEVIETIRKNQKEKENETDK